METVIIHICRTRFTSWSRFSYPKEFRIVSRGCRSRIMRALRTEIGLHFIDNNNAAHRVWCHFCATDIGSLRERIPRYWRWLPTERIPATYIGSLRSAYCVADVGFLRSEYRATDVGFLRSKYRGTDVGFLQSEYRYWHWLPTGANTALLTFESWKQFINLNTNWELKIENYGGPVGPLIHF